VTLILRQGLVPVVVGSALGVLVVLVGARLLASLLYDVNPRDPVAIGGAILAFTLVALVAALIPARRAAATDPAVALRAE
jgi:ABC-type antimicrobial peptide transport system permease subunit